MNVEHGPTAAAHGRSGDVGHGKGKTPGALAGAGGMPEEGGFLTLLTALGVEEGVAGEDAQRFDVGVGAVPADAPPVPTAWWPDGDPASMRPADAPPVGDAPRGASAAPPSWTLPEQMLLGRQLAESLPDGAGRIARAEAVQAAAAPGASPAEPTPAPPAARPAEHGLKPGQEDALRNLAGPLGRAVAEPQQAAAPGGPLPRSAMAEAGPAHGSPGEPRVRAAAAEARFRLDLADPAAQATEQTLMAATAALPAAAERRSDKAGEPAGRLPGDAAWSRPFLGPEGGDVPTVPADTAMGGPALHVAEQVSYWIANDIQNAELKLDHFGHSPVEVSISLQGNEARVEFRTDLQEMRQVLQEAMTQLKDMLHSQGLVLAGVSVGMAGADASGSREQSSARQSPRQARVSVPAVAPGEGGRMRPVPLASGRALDVFV